MTFVMLRRYQDTDHASVWKLHVDGLNQTGSFVPDPVLDADFQNIRGIYLENGGDFLIAQCDESIVGMGAIRKIDHTTAEVKRMRVNAHYQSRGIGSMILSRLITRANELGYQRLVLDTSRKQLAAQKLYEKHGFVRYHSEDSSETSKLYYELRLRA